MRKFILLSIMFMKDRDYIKAIKLLNRTVNYNKPKMNEYQNKKLRELIHHAYTNVDYYRKLFDKNDINPDSIKTIDDLDKIPILTKKDIINNYDSIWAKNFTGKYSSTKTGGSTGQRLEYINSNFDLRLSTMLLLNGYKYAGYEYGDHVVTIGGTSVVDKSNIKTRIKTFFSDFTFNFKSFSTVNSNEQTFNNIITHLNKKKKTFLRGYKSSIYLLAKYILDNDINLKHEVRAVFTTSEKLLQTQRDIIEKAFQCKVYDQYGLNDGGISAFQNNHGEYLIDFERSIIEVVNNEGKQVYNIEGRIIGTSLYNLHMPFIRYDSEDLGIKQYNHNGKDYLIDIVGKSNDILSFKDNFNITPILNKILRNYELNNYQVIKRNDKLEINISSENTNLLALALEKDLTESLEGISYTLNFVPEEEFYTHSNGKHKYIIDLSKD
ncbi:MAG TPA: hypothetical protein DEB42_00740 [Jeotgalicoccus sp.]|nr:hypothetical protein [Jeotgalicoccus sp.]